MDHDARIEAAKAKVGSHRDAVFGYLRTLGAFEAHPIKREEVDEYLNRSTAHQLHRVGVKRINQPIIADVPLERVQMDEIILEKGSPTYNRALCLIDIYSRKAWVYPHRNETAEVLIHSMDRWLDDLAANPPMHRVSKSLRRPVPRIIQSDNGANFTSALFNEWAQRHDIRHITSGPFSPTSQGAVERFNGTLKRRMFALMSEKGEADWSKVIPIAVRQYNNSIHTNVGRSPNAVWDEGEPNDWKRVSVAGADNVRFRKGDKVRILLTKRVDTKHRKSYVQHWSREVYTVEGRHAALAPGGNKRYTLNERSGYWYSNEMHDVKGSDAESSSSEDEASDVPPLDVHHVDELERPAKLGRSLEGRQFVFRGNAVAVVRDSAGNVLLEFVEHKRWTPLSLTRAEFLATAQPVEQALRTRTRAPSSRLKDYAV